MFVPFLRARARPRRSAACIVASALFAVALLLPRAAILGMPDAATIAPQRTWQPASAAEAFSGEIHYEFDTTLNKTSARFVVPIGSRGLMHKIFFSTPAVHTLVVSYKYAGARSRRIPDTVRISFKSDEYEYSASENRPPPAADPYLTIDVGDQRRTYPLAIAQRTDVTQKSDVRNRESVYLRGVGPITQPSPPLVEVHIARTSTAWLPICDFLELTNLKEIRGTVAGLDFSLDREAVVGLREFLAQMGEAATGKGEEGRARIDCTGR